jgi:hypothetical protein
MHSIISMICVEIANTPTFLPTFMRRLIAACIAPKVMPLPPSKKPTQPDTTGVPPPVFWIMGPTVLHTYCSAYPVSLVSFYRLGDFSITTGQHGLEQRCMRLKQLPHFEQHVTTSLPIVFHV